MKTTVENTAIIPVPKLEEDSYDWWERHEAILAQKADINPEIVMIGDSITHFWGGKPECPNVHGGTTWNETFGDTPVLNMGYGWDRTQNVLWRLEHGELDGLHPRVIVIHIGTNNFAETENARANEPEEVFEGIMAVCRKVHDISPESKVVLMKIFPRGQYPDDPLRTNIAALNEILAQRISSLPYVTMLDIGDKFIEPDGTISENTLFDFTHLTPAAYKIWARALKDAGVVGK